MLIPYARQTIDETDIESVLAVLRSDWLTQGPAVERFESAVAGFCRARYAVAVTNATSALHIACLAAGLDEGDWLWTSPNTFVASANCALYCKARVDFVDIDPRTYNMSVTALRDKLAVARKAGKLPKVVIPVHFAGQPCLMQEIAELAREYGFIIIEDAAHAIGGAYQGKPVGAGEFADLTVFSFHPAKIITTGEGGMVLTPRQDLYEKLIRLRTHGITRSPQLMEGECEGPWYYQQIDLGFNYRMTDIQAALGISQLRRIHEFVTRRRYLVKRYNEGLADLPLTLPWQHPEVQSSWHLYVVRLQLEKIRQTRRQVFEEMRKRGVGVNVHYIPVHRQPYYRRFGFKEGDFPEAEQYYRETLTLPLYYGLSLQEQDEIIEALHEVIHP